MQPTEPGKDAPGKSQSKLPPPPPTKPEHSQTRSSSAQPPLAKLPPAVQPVDPKRKRSTKGKEPMDEGKSCAPHEEDEGRRASKRLRVASSDQEKEVDVQPKPQAWLPAPMLHGEPLRDNTSLRDFNKSEGTYVADAVERSLLLPVDMEDLRNLRSKELFLSMKRYLGMVRSLAHSAFLVLVSWFSTYALSPPN